MVGFINEVEIELSISCMISLWPGNNFFGIRVRVVLRGSFHFSVLKRIRAKYFSSLSYTSGNSKLFPIPFFDAGWEGASQRIFQLARNPNICHCTLPKRSAAKIVLKTAMQTTRSAQEELKSRD